MIDTIENHGDITRYRNCHSLAIIDHQCMKVVRKSLPVLIETLRSKLNDKIWEDKDILYMVPTGKEYKTLPIYRIKNDKFTGTISDGVTNASKKGSIAPLLNWLEQNSNLGESRVFISRYIGSALEL